MNVQYSAAQTMARFSKVLIDESTKEKIEPELQMIQLLILRDNDDFERQRHIAVEDTNK